MNLFGLLIKCKESIKDSLTIHPILILLRAITVKEVGNIQATEEIANLVQLAVAKGLALPELEGEEMSRIV